MLKPYPTHHSSAYFQIIDDRIKQNKTSTIRYEKGKNMTSFTETPS